MKKIIILISFLLLNACASNSSNYVKFHKAKNLKTAQKLNLEINKPAKIPYRGLVSNNSITSAGGSILYPGNTAGTLLAAIFTHAVVADSIKESKLNELQELADSKIFSLKPIYEQITFERLLSRQPSIESKFQLLDADDESTVDGLVVKILPIFYLSQDHSFIKLKNAVSVFKTLKHKKPIYQNLIEVIGVSDVSDGESNLVFWEADNTLELVSSELFSKSLSLIQKDINDKLPSISKQKTFKFSLGESMSVERGNLVEQSCENITIRSLRGWLKTVPRKVIDSNLLDCKEV